MSGAYVAKPAVATEVDYPPGWDVNWIFPGPFPPGYTPSLTTPITAPAQIAESTPIAAVSTVLYDQGSYATAEPSAKTITWTSTETATGGPTGTFADVGDDFWGDSGTYTFSGVSAGDIITISATSNPFALDGVSAAAQIEVVDDDELEAGWDIEVSVTTLSPSTSYEWAIWDAGDAVADGEAYIDGADGYAEVWRGSHNNDGTETLTDSSGEHYSVGGSYLLKNTQLGYGTTYWAGIWAGISLQVANWPEYPPGTYQTATGSISATCVIRIYQTLNGARTLKLTKSYTLSDSNSITSVLPIGVQTYDTSPTDKYIEFSITAGAQPSEDTLNYEEFTE